MYPNLASVVLSHIKPQFHQYLELISKKWKIIIERIIREYYDRNHRIHITNLVVSRNLILLFRFWKDDNFNPTMSNTILSFACEIYDKILVKVAISKGANGWNNALEHICCHSHPILLDENASRFPKSGCQKHFDAKNGIVIAKLIIAESTNREYAFQVAYDYENFVLAELIISNNFNINRALLCACRNNDVHMVQWLINYLKNHFSIPNNIWRHWFTCELKCIHLYQNFEIAKVLLKNDVIDLDKYCEYTKKRLCDNPVQMNIFINFQCRILKYKARLKKKREKREKEKIDSR